MLLLVLFPLSVSSIASTPSDSISVVAQHADTSRGNLNLLAAPYITGNSDVGLTFGFGFGVTRNPDLYAISSFEISTDGRFVGLLEGEYDHRRLAYVGKLQFTRGERFTYPITPIDPDPATVAIEERFELRFSALHQFNNIFEAGPSVWLETAKGLEPEDMDGFKLSIDDLPPYSPAALAVAGPRVRWKTTSTYRPVDGYILDLTLQGGEVWYDHWKNSKPELTGEGWASIAKPVHPRLRFYVRGAARFQANAPPSVRNHVGGDRTVRGQPLWRERGRKVLLAREQIHWTVLRDWGWPMQVLNDIAGFIPAHPINVELVGFHDMGMAGDPKYGWNPVRHGVGGGIRIIVPYDLVFRIDAAVSPGGSLKLYFSVGETI